MRKEIFSSWSCIYCWQIWSVKFKHFHPTEYLPTPLSVCTGYVLFNYTFCRAIHYILNVIIITYFTCISPNKFLKWLICILIPENFFDGWFCFFYIPVNISSCWHSKKILSWSHWPIVILSYIFSGIILEYTCFMSFM